MIKGDGHVFGENDSGWRRPGHFPGLGDIDASRWRGAAGHAARRGGPPHRDSAVRRGTLYLVLLPFGGKSAHLGGPHPGPVGKHLHRRGTLSEVRCGHGQDARCRKHGESWPL
ncbi:hypothetical protein DESC_730132 [Desulfosarcina cetonica]|nr:hypothetical protein DESC_730132 [Desulfosarcina cetonica]